MSFGGLWQIDIQKSNETEFWTNVYHCDRASFSEAKDTALAIVAAEKTIHTQHVQFVSMRIRAYPSGGQQGTVFQLDGTGAVGASEFLPLFNVARVTFSVEQGRPSRKYYRLPVGEGEQQYGVWTPSKITFLNNLLTAMLNIPGLCDESGNEFVGISLVPQVGMRQLRRGSKRRAAPVIPVS